VSQVRFESISAHVSAVNPTLNEARNVPCSRVPADVHEVIVVDGQSVDDTMAVASRLRPEVRVVQQTRRGRPWL
jgi:hypothetical protein